jgi:hypothetical protein
MPMGLTRHFLHASQLTLQLPSGETKIFNSALPPELEKVLIDLREIK